MVQSMTGFGRAEVSKQNYQVSVEIKSVNHRFKDFRFKMPNAFMSLEMDLREKLSTFFKRGSIDVFIRYKKIGTTSLFQELDQEKIKLYLQSLTEFLKTEEAKGLKVALQVTPQDFLRSEFFKEQESTIEEALLETLNEAFIKAVQELKISRDKEGEKLIQIIKLHLQDYLECFKRVEQLANQFQAQVESKIRTKLEEMARDTKIDEPRFAQEIIYYLERMDIHEEINRIKTHMDKLQKLLNGKSEKGRQVDFLLQELNRETNTIGSKSNHAQISDDVIQMKVHLEKMREQGLNLE